MGRKYDSLILLTVRFIAILCGFIGIFYLIQNFREHLYIFTGMFSHKYPGVEMQIWFIVISICSLLILILRPIAGYGLFKFTKWGRKLTIYILSADFIIRMLTIVNVTTYAGRHPEICHKIAEMQTSGDIACIHTSSMIPTYNIALLSLISVIFLILNRKWDYKLN